MGLDIYVGTLTRYYAGDWQTVVQQSAAAMGGEVRVVRPNEVADAVTDPAEIRAAVLAWRDQLNASLAEHLAAPLTWREDDDAPYFTDKPAWDCFGALLLWAAHEEHPELPRPADVTAESWLQDAAYQASNARDFRTRYPNLLSPVELWLPGDFRFVFRTEDVAGNDVFVGSCAALRDELEALNARTWKADDAQLEAWRRAGAEERAPFEQKARFALAVCHALAGQAVAATLPMKLDY